MYILSAGIHVPASFFHKVRNCAPATASESSLNNTGVSMLTGTVAVRHWRLRTAIFAVERERPSRIFLQIKHRMSVSHTARVKQNPIAALRSHARARGASQVHRGPAQGTRLRLAQGRHRGARGLDVKVDDAVRVVEEGQPRRHVARDQASLAIPAAVDGKVSTLTAAENQTALSSYAVLS